MKILNIKMPNATNASGLQTNNARIHSAESSKASSQNLINNAQIKSSGKKTSTDTIEIRHRCDNSNQSEYDKKLSNISARVSNGSYKIDPDVIAQKILYATKGGR